MAVISVETEGTGIGAEGSGVMRIGARSSLAPRPLNAAA
jgi:hypothetical protein